MDNHQGNNHLVSSKIYVWRQSIRNWWPGESDDLPGNF